MLGDLLRQALAAKSAELGERYGWRRLARESGMAHSHLFNVRDGTRGASPEVVAKLAEALAPHLALDHALVEAGHLPASPRIMALLRRIVRMSGADLTRVERCVDDIEQQ